MDYKPPEYLSLQGNIAENWRVWKSRFETYLVAKEMDDKSNKIKKAVLLTCIGPEAHERYETFGMAADSTLVQVMDKFESHFKGEKRTVFHRFQFWSLARSEGEPIMEFIGKLKLLAKDCEFAEEQNMIRDKVVFTVKEKQLKERLLRETDLTLAKCEEICRAFEVTQEEMRKMCTPMTSTASVHAIKHKREASHVRHQQKPQAKETALPSHKSRWKCKRCGTRHARGECPAYGKTCTKCQYLHHFASECRTGQGRSRKVHEIEATGDSSDSDEFWIGSVAKCLTVTSVPRKEKGWFVCVSVGPGRAKVKMKVDTGAETNTIPLRTWQKISDPPPVQPSNTVLHAYGNTSIAHAGRAVTTLQVGDSAISTEVYITRGKTVPILGLDACKQLGLVQPGPNGRQVHTVSQSTNQPLTPESLQTEYADLFTGLGKFPGDYKIELQEGAQPVVHHARRVPPALYKPLKDKLHDMEEKGVIAPADGPTDWVNSLVLVEKKNGSLRVCLDPRDLNKAIKREQFQIPTFEEVITRLGGKRVFTILDLKESYWQVQLEDSSSKLCTFNTPFGRYSFKRMPFGIKSASEVLQKKAYAAYGDIEGVFIIADDMLVAGVDDDDHDRVLRAVLDRARDIGNRFNLEKVQFKLPEVHYMGRTVGRDGVRPDEEKIKAIQEMPEPTDKEGVRRLLGMLNFLSTFIPDMSTITAPLRGLMKADTPWQWLPEHSKAVLKLKEIISARPVLKLYDSTKPVAIQCDASSTGLGACLLQESQPVAYASRALTGPETRYAQIEREMLAIVFAAEQFHHYIYGNEVEVMSDHRPLESIVQKSLRDLSPRLQLMRLRLLRYKLAVHYVPGSKMYIADTLSRAHGAQNTADEKPDEFRVHSLTTRLPATPQRIQDLQSATQGDVALCKLRDYVYKGWPVHKSACFPDVKQYWGMKDTIHEDDGLLYIGERLIVPTSLRADMLSKLHVGHLGMEKSKARARECLYWPNMSADIEDMVSKCSTCATFKPQNQPEPLLPHPVPGRPWQKVGADIFDFNGKDFLVVVDYYSKYPEVVQLRKKTAEDVIRVLKPIFARHGIPDQFMSDNMPFQSHVMRQFADEWGFSLITSSPTYAQSNGQSERFVGIAKSILRKAALEGRDPNLALLEYRTTPLSGLEYSPAQLLMSRRLRGVIPVSSNLLQPTAPKDPQRKLTSREQQQKQHYDRHARSHWRSPPQIGDNIRVRLGRTWDSGVIVGKHDAPRSYYVTTEGGQTYRRNQRFINPNQEKVWIMPPDTDTESSGRQNEAPDRPPSSPHPQRSIQDEFPPETTPQRPLADKPPVCPTPSSSPTAEMSQSPRRSTRCRKKPQWHKDYVQK